MIIFTTLCGTRIKKKNYTAENISLVDTGWWSVHSDRAAGLLQQSV